MVNFFRLLFIIYLLSFSTAWASIPLGIHFRFNAGSYATGLYPNNDSGVGPACEEWRVITGSATIDSCSISGVRATTSDGRVFQGSNSGPQYGTCPANSTKSGTVCECNKGFVENGSMCVPAPPPDPCDGLADMCSGSQGKSGSFSISGKNLGVSFTCMSPLSFGANPLPGCSKGCMAQVGNYPTAMQDSSGKWVTSGIAKYSGSTCDPSVINDLNKEADPQFQPEENPKTADSPDPDCPNGFKGTVNGISVCVPPKASSGTTEMETKDNGDGTKTNSKTEVKCENGKCDITKTTTTTNTTTNSTVSSSSVTTTVDKSAYCSQNKTAGACKDEKGENSDGNGKFGGSCAAGFTCEGDAVQCAMAKEQHKRMCQALEPEKDPASFIKQAEAGTDSKSADQLKKEATSINISTDLNTAGYGLSRSCPADPRIDMPFANASFTIPFSAACPTLKVLSDVALAITALSLLVWLVAGRTKDEN